TSLMEAAASTSLPCMQLAPSRLCAVDQTGHLSQKSIRATLRFLRSLKPGIVPGEIDWSDPLKPEHMGQSGPSSHQQ
ncbi:hypothetical protein AAVH_42958, partial [Aphelenchoides avenae]